MNNFLKSQLAPIAVFLWIGFVCAISFMEAWLKFQAPGVTMAVGLGIGQLVFNALNTVEWAFAIVIAASLLVKGHLFSVKNVLYFIPLVLLILQTFWALPALDARAGLWIRGETPPPSYLHFYYVGMEALKIGCLLFFGLNLLNSWEVKSTACAKSESELPYDNIA